MLMFTRHLLLDHNLPCFLELTFQVPMQYCSLWNQTLLSAPNTYITGCRFCFASASSFFLELFLHSSPVAYLTPTNLGVGGAHLPVSYSFAFSYCSWCSVHSIFYWPKIKGLSDISPARMDLFKISRWLQFRIYKHIESQACPHMIREEVAFIRWQRKLGGKAAVNNETMTFQWLSSCQERKQVFLFPVQLC